MQVRILSSWPIFDLKWILKEDIKVFGHVIYDTGSNPTCVLCFFLQFLENFQTLRANYPFGRSWAIEGPFLIKSPHFRPNLSLGPIHVHPRVLCEN